MPPRAVKKAAGTPTPKKAAGKTPSKTPKSAGKTPPPEPEEKVVAPAEDVKVEVAPAKHEEKDGRKLNLNEQSVEAAATVEKSPLRNGSAVEKDKEAVDEAKPSFDEDDKGERLELDDNEPESEPEEEDNIEDGSKDDAATMDVDEKEVDGIPQEDEEEGLEDQLDEGEGEDAEEPGEDEFLGEEGEGEEMEGEGEEEGGEEHEEPDEEEEEHHKVVKERRKRKEFEIFVGGLDKDATEDDLKKVFNAAGEIVEVRLMMNPQTHKNKGFAFIRYASVDQAKRACADLKNPQVKGKICGVSPSQDNDTLFVGNVCKTWTKDALKDKLKHYGIENIEDLTLVEDTQNEGMNRGFAFLEFSARADAMNAYKRLQKRDVVFGTDRTAKVSFAETFVEPDEEVMAQVKTVFVDGLPATWDEDRVKDQFKKYGEIEKIQLARNMPTARRRDFGFVSFTSHDAAVACINGVNNNELGEGDNKVKVKARLSKPHQKGRLLKHGVRGGYRIGRGGASGWRRPRGRAVAGRFEPRRVVGRGGRFVGRGGTIGGRGVKGLFGRNVVAPFSERVPSRNLPPVDRVRERRPPAYPRSSSRRDYGRREDPYDDRPVRSSTRSAPDFATRAAATRRSSYRDSYASRGSSYSDSAPRGVSRSASRRLYPEDNYDRRVDRPYREARGREYEPVSGSKRPYAAVEEPPRYADPTMRHSRARMDYGVSAGPSHYDDYAEPARLGRGSQLGYGSSARQDSYGLYDGRQSSMGYGGGSLSGSEAGGVYSSGYGNDYLSSGANIGGGSYSSMYSSRGMGGGYLGGSGSGSYY
uniref:TSA: Wollemia nobilis Ref_Wollemi_Transcript_13398_3140 transcribed RNA sequence n=1 Tax=Wollemia nobilis TaxID=56998 RepID=A0A0C9S532_9CONI